MPFERSFHRPAKASRVLDITGAAAAYDSVEVMGKHPLLVVTAMTDLHVRFTPSPLIDGGFEKFLTWADVDLAEGSALRTNPLGPWLEKGTVGAVTLNKTAPLVGDGDVLMALDDEDTRLLQRQISLKGLQAYRLAFDHLESDAGSEIEVALREADGIGGVKYLQSGGTWDAAEAWLGVTGSATQAQENVDFTSDLATVYELLFRTAGAAIGETSNIDRVYFSEVPVVTDQLLVPAETIYLPEFDGHFSFISDAEAGKVSVSELETE
jgi:hypothetical protein